MFFIYFGALQVGEENVDLALSFIGYDKEIEKAMQYVFGTSFVANDVNTAKKVRFFFQKV